MIFQSFEIREGNSVKLSESILFDAILSGITKHVL